MYLYLVHFCFFSSASNGGNSAEKCRISVSIQKGILMELWKADKHAENSKFNKCPWGLESRRVKPRNIQLFFFFAMLEIGKEKKRRRHLRRLWCNVVQTVEVRKRDWRPSEVEKFAECLNFAKRFFT